MSIGEIVTLIRTGLGPLHTMSYNPYNAVVHLGHGNGTVSLWTPNMGKPAVKMLCHRANVTGIGVDISGRYGLAQVYEDVIANEICMHEEGHLMLVGFSIHTCQAFI